MQERTEGHGVMDASTKFIGWSSSGPAATLWIANDTSQTVKVKKQTSYHMPGWKFVDVPPRSCKSFKIMFAQGWFKFETSDKGTAIFEVLGGGTFKVVASWGPFPRLSVDWKGVDADAITVFPPPNADDKVCDLGWSEDGTMCLLLQDKVSSRHPTDIEPSAVSNALLEDALETQDSQEAEVSVEPCLEFDHLWASPYQEARNSSPRKCSSGSHSSSAYPRLQFETQDAKKIFAALGPSDEDKITDEDASKFALALASKERTPMPVGGWERNWMEKYADVIGGLTLEKMSLPCSHDSGTYSGISPFAQMYAKTQSLSISRQLELGIRVLDIRIGQYSPGNYIISHDIWRTDYTLANALKEVKEFVDSTEKEIVVLDFHRFNVLMWKDMGFDFKALRTQIKAALGEHYIPALVGKGKTLNEIWENSAGRRIIVCWNGPSPDEYMWPRVDQHWYQHANDLTDLGRAISEDIKKGEKGDGFWSMCVFRTVDFDHTPHSNAKDAFSEIEGWFFGCSKWTQAANIIAVDFFYEFSNVVQACVCANLLKGRHDVPLVSPQGLDQGWVIVDPIDVSGDGH
ncbi:hypothetical protein BSKO_02991 [Bryopsis sp. KO-2023]|nr:hypothetical protein BSKO_02991 [Bryopsis sp. KO-2023]